MKASIGRTIIVLGIHSNGSDEHPGVITRVWSNKDTAEEPVMVNATVFPDCSAPVSRGSIMLHDSRAAAAQWASQQPPGHASVLAFWPDRV